MKFASIVGVAVCPAAMLVAGCSPGGSGEFPGEIAATSDGDGSAAANHHHVRFGISVSPPAARVCPGACVTLDVQAGGGTPPYTFRWDQGLPASGTVRVCPTRTTTYTVTADDSSGPPSGGAPTPDAEDIDHTTITVDPACDAGFVETPEPTPVEQASDGGDDEVGPPPGMCNDPDDTPWSGCMTFNSGNSTTPSQAYGGWCEMPSATLAAYSFGLCLPYALLPGQGYQVDVTYDLQMVTGPAPRSAILASAAHCATGATLFPMSTWPVVTPFTGSFSQSACVTPAAAYRELTVEMVQDLYSGIGSSEVSFQICTGCTATSPAAPPPVETPAADGGMR
jgi:hypothetical protein